MNNSSVILVAGHSVVRLGLRTLLTVNAITVSGEAANALEAEALASRLHPDIVVFDAGLSDADNLEGLKRIARATPPTRIIFLSERDDEGFVEQALMSGASCYVLKETATADLCWAIKAAQKGREYFSPTLIRRLRDPGATIPEPDQVQDLSGPAVSGVEARLVTMINQGSIIKQLARELRDNIESISQAHPAPSPKLIPRRRVSLPGWRIIRRLLGVRSSPQLVNSGAV
jgi:DNA-binding NarL/FixJ family response regulator